MSDGFVPEVDPVLHWSIIARGDPSAYPVTAARPAMPTT